MNYNAMPSISTDESEDQLSAVVASDYDRESRDGGWDSPERAQRLVEAYIGKDTLVLDIGTGTGEAAKGYIDKGAMVVALDRDPDMLKVAAEKIGNKGVYRTADVNLELPIKDIEGVVDVAQAIGVTEFAKDLSGFIDQVGVALVVGGKFVFTVEEPGSDGQTEMYHPENDLTTHRHSQEEVEELLAESGFELISHQGHVGYTRDGNEDVPYHIYLAEKVNKDFTDQPFEGGETERMMNFTIDMSDEYNPPERELLEKSIGQTMADIRDFLGDKAGVIFDGLKIKVDNHTVGGGGEAITDENTVVLNGKNTLPSLAEMRVPAGYRPDELTGGSLDEHEPGSALKYVLVHELGHILDESTKAGEKLHRVSAAESPTVYGRQPDEYNTEKDHEAFAEGFAHMVYGMPVSETLLRAVLETIEAKYAEAQNS